MYWISGLYRFLFGRRARDRKTLGQTEIYTKKYRNIAKKRSASPGIDKAIEDICRNALDAAVFWLTSVMVTFLKKEKKLFSNMVVCVPIRGLFRYFVFVRGSDTNKTHRKTDIRANIGIPSACARRQVSLTKMLLSSCSE